MYHATTLFAALYGAILAFHFGFAWFLMTKKGQSLAAAGVSDPVMILVILLVINGFSLSVFFWPNPSWVLANIFYHVALTVDEIIRTKKATFRWPFVLNHFLFLVVLTGFYFRASVLA